MAKSGTRSRREQVIAFVHGARDGEVIHITVSRKDGTVKLTDAHGTERLVNTRMNPNDLAGWEREARLVWKLSDAFSVTRELADTAETKAKLETFTIGVEKSKKEEDQT